MLSQQLDLLNLYKEDSQEEDSQKDPNDIHRQRSYPPAGFLEKNGTHCPASRCQQRGNFPNVCLKKHGTGRLFLGFHHKRSANVISVSRFIHFYFEKDDFDSDLGSHPKSANYDSNFDFGSKKFSSLILPKISTSM